MILMEVMGITKNKIFVTLLIFCLICSTIKISAQQRYWVFFKDKSETTFDPFTYFDAKAIERRVVNNISLYDSTDFPVNTDYIKAVETITDSVFTVSRWFNAVTVIADENRLLRLKSLIFVKDIQPVLISTKPASYDYETSLSFDQEILLKNQLERMNGNLFVTNNLTGKGIRIAVFDAGFPSVDTIPVFTDLRNKKRIVKTYDFARKKDYVYAHNNHGTMVLSCIAGQINGKNIGLATDAEFLLARTEIESEPYSEEENWLAAAEWADKNGADIINSSLGYTYHRYFTFEMNGQTSLVAKAANLASNKGILVVNAMGNDGDNDWKILSTPADADSILSVGGISPVTDYHIDFSSYGPTADKRLKPNVVAYGTAVVASQSKLEQADGTSFSAPLVTGFAACAWQSDRGKNNQELKKMIEKSGDLYPYFDYAHGFGVPQAGYFTKSENTDSVNITFRFQKINDNVKIFVNEEYIEKRKNINNYLYVHIENNDGVIIKYWLIDVYQSDAISISLKDFNDAYKIKAHYKKYTKDFIPDN